MLNLLHVTILAPGILKCVPDFFEKIVYTCVSRPFFYGRPGSDFGWLAEGRSLLWQFSFPSQLIFHKLSKLIRHTRLVDLVHVEITGSSYCGTRVYHPTARRKGDSGLSASQI